MVTTPERLSEFPDVPTAREAGYPDLEGMVGWSVLAAPPNLPADIKSYWVDLLAKIGNDAEWIEAEKKLGSVPYILSPKDTEQFIKRQYDIYSALAQELDLMIK